MELQSGKTYLIQHSRKGTFMMKVKSQDSNFTYGVMAAGKACAMMEHNERFKGDDIGVRTAFITNAVEQP